ncbi:hypothetical protein KJ969_04810 [Patescibacteria group bacterium]|nr:hypothetical protein [Patescibacteria group bacterium]
MDFRHFLSKKLWIFTASLTIAVICIFLVNQLLLAWVGPSAPPPGDNVPGVIWNLNIGADSQTAAEFNIDGNAKIGQDFWLANNKAVRADAPGDTTIWFGNWDAGATGFKLGVTDEVEAFGSVSSTLFCLSGDCIDAWPAGGADGNWTDTGAKVYHNSIGEYGDPDGGFEINYTGDVQADGNIYAGGDISAAGCVGPVVVGVTVTALQGNQGGYVGANVNCAAEYAGSHVCTAEEVLKSINCGAPLPGAGVGWISAGPPGFTAGANDCKGWTNNEASMYGRLWNFATGMSWMTTCNMARPNACCK